MEIPREQILKECDNIIKESKVDGFIKHFIQEYIKHHMSHIFIKNNYEIDPLGEEDWDDKIILSDDIECKFDLNSLPISVEILTRLNLKNKKLFIVDNLSKLSWNRCRIFNGYNSTIELHKNALIRENVSIINKELEYGKNFKVRIMAELSFNKNDYYDELILKNIYKID